MKAVAFTHDVPPQRVVFASGALSRVADEVAPLKVERALIVATPGSGVRLGQKVSALLGPRAAGLHAQAVVHVPKAVAEAGLAAARETKADGVIAVGGGSAIGLAKAIALETGLPILAIPTTYSGSEATPIIGMTDGERKITGRDIKVVPRTIIYDPDLTLGLPAAVSASSGLNAIAHCVEALWVDSRTPVTIGLATEAMRRFAQNLPAVVADGANVAARAECLIGAWLAGTVLSSGTALHHKLAHVLGGLGLPHAETHAILLPHVMRFNLQAAPEAKARLQDALGSDDPAAAVAAMLKKFPIPQRLHEVGFDAAKADFVAKEIAAASITAPRQASASDVRELLAAAY
ncbi:MAG TPA: maleylacetate reductase [Xanthobacteraceae bacterium]|nr:maleylacetate reductase [Xanthobacteraceae bacterium]